jgi:basic amino acid/polyamine antiporter, APA family
MLIFLSLAIASIVLRRAEPDLARPWRMPLFPLPAILSAAVNIVLLVLFIAGDWKTGLCSALLLAAAFPLYAYGHNRWRGRAAGA